ncbi:hypothetical protein TWF481_011039 [Arthrobotrys musiformis]|uniref:Uncharacterized protein n=1 Tax=Arthrobotrys musiformis TaxID=47236 RepID=A0AAV9VY85_9PEZI
MGPRFYCGRMSASIPKRGPHTRIVRVRRLRVGYFCPANDRVTYHPFEDPSAPGSKKFNDMAIGWLMYYHGASGLYNPKTKVYVEFTSSNGGRTGYLICTNGDTTDITPLKDYLEDDAIWEMVYTEGDGDIVPCLLRILEHYITYCCMMSSITPCLVHEDIKQGLYLPTWAKYLKHRWNCSRGKTSNGTEVKAEEAQHPKEKPE